MRGLASNVSPSSGFRFGSSAQELDGLVRSEMNQWGPLIRQLGLKAE
ncbi:hypothetical protein LJR084_007608 [Variovorax sp. LjRoot84]